MMLVTTHVMGGIGNQLFQVFNLISYALTNKVAFFLKQDNLTVQTDRFIGIIF